MEMNIFKIITEISVTVIYVIWFVNSIIMQFNNQAKKIKPIKNIFWILPSWRFFSPIPLKLDYQLFYRDELPNEEFTKWVEITPKIKRSFANCFWNPSFYNRKVYSDLAQSMFRLSELVPEPQGWPEHISYQCLIHYIKTKTHHENAVNTQFYLITIPYYENVWIRSWSQPL